MKPLGSPAPQQPTRLEVAERLSAAKDAWCAQQKFEVGDLVVPAPFVTGYSNRPFVEAMVMETCPDLRGLMKDPNQPAGQGILLAFLSGNDVAFGWYPAWQYVLAEPLPARALNA